MKNRREFYSKDLNSLYLTFYRPLCDLLSEAWQPYYGLRSFGEQDMLWAKGRSAPGTIITNARGGYSPHNYGCATDWTVFEDGKPVWMDREDPRWQDYQNAIEKVGLKWGGEWKDNYHNEINLSCSWSHVHVEFVKLGMRGASEYIESALKKA